MAITLTPGKTGVTVDGKRSTDATFTGDAAGYVITVGYPLSAAHYKSLGLINITDVLEVSTSATAAGAQHRVIPDVSDPAACTLKLYTAASAELATGVTAVATTAVLRFIGN